MKKSSEQTKFALSVVPTSSGRGTSKRRASRAPKGNTATVFLGVNPLTDLVGFRAVTAAQATALQSLGFSTVILPDGSWLAGERYRQPDRPPE